MSKWESGIDVDATEALGRLEALEKVLDQIRNGEEVDVVSGGFEVLEG